MINSPEILGIAGNSTLFHGIPRDVLAPVYQKALVISLGQGEQLLTPGIINEHVYLIISGQLNVQMTPSILDEPIAILNPGDCVGEMSVLVDCIVSAYVIARTDCQLLSIDYSSFWALIKGANGVARNMLNVLVQRIRMGNEALADTLMNRDKFPDIGVIDNLTGLYNQYGMQRKIELLLNQYAANTQSICLVILKIDGHENSHSSENELRGEQYLRTLAQMMLYSLRPGDHAARLSRKKFAILFANLPLSEACAAAEKLRAKVSQVPITLPNGSSQPPLSISAGVVQAKADETWDMLLDRANLKLEQAIMAGGDCVTPG